MHPKTPSILMVDDRPENLLTLEAVLGDLELDLVRAKSGPEALKLLLDRDFSLILLDVQMPGMDGFETAALIRGRERSRMIPIVFVTAISSAREHISRGYGLGAVDYIIKPFTAEEMRAKALAYVDMYRQKLDLEEEAFSGSAPELKINILLVDNRPENILTMTEILRPLGGGILTAASGNEALSILMKKAVSLILMDVQMPGMDGFETAGIIKENQRLSQIPIIFISAISQATEDVRRGYEMGALDYLFSPYTPEILFAKVRGLVDLQKRTRQLRLPMDKIRRLNEELSYSKEKLRDANLELEERVLERTEELQENAEKLGKSLALTRQTLAGAVEALARVVESRDPYTAGHQKRVAELSAVIAADLGCTEEEIETIRTAGVIHDLGKISIPAEILSKSGKLSAIELSLIKCHPANGYEILKNVTFPGPVAEIVHQHHERLDGSGYPRGLTGEAILREARIMAVADVVEAMASHRPYRPALGIEAALAELARGKGKIYDAEVVAACERVVAKDPGILRL